MGHYLTFCVVFIVIDEKGYRANVGIIICNNQNEVFWARRKGQNAWQFPQGGMKVGETHEAAMFRELKEEVGLEPEHVEIIASTTDWLHYDLPEHLIRYDKKPVCIGQKQYWFLLRMTCDESCVCFNCSDNPEFDDWQWVEYWQPVKEIIEFKRDVYQKALAEFEKHVV